MRYLALLSALVGTLGCATGTTETAEGEDEGGGLFTGAGGFGGDADGTTSSTTSGVGGTGHMGGFGGFGGMTSSGGMGGMGSGGMPSTCDFSTTQSCDTGTQLSAVSGDEGGSVSATGTTSAWFRVKIEETSSSWFEKDLSYTVTLESPPGMDYDLFVKQGPQAGSVDCGTTSVAGMGSGSTESVSDGWDDDQGFGGEDDSLWLAIEVVYVSGNDCVTPWILTIQGNT